MTLPHTIELAGATMDLEAGKCRIRSWRRADLRSLVENANNVNVSRNLRDAFPSPYTEENAQQWLAVVACMQPETQFAIEVDGEAVGGIGLSLGSDVHRIDAELGYWLGEGHWGRGIVTAAINAFVPYSFGAYGLERVHAHVFEWNRASSRVLEKAGFQLEGRLRHAAMKEGALIDILLFARIRTQKRQS